MFLFPPSRNVIKYLLTSEAQTQLRKATRLCSCNKYSWCCCSCGTTVCAPCWRSLTNTTVLSAASTSTSSSRSSSREEMITKSRWLNTIFSFFIWFSSHLSHLIPLNLSSTFIRRGYSLSLFYFWALTCPNVYRPAFTEFPFLLKPPW